jgi:sialate O-acetylesterase
MKLILRLALGWSLTLGLVSAQAEQAMPFVTPMFGSHMVLQRGKTNKIWGWAKPGDRITVTLADRAVTTTAGADGQWRACFTPPTAIGPHTLQITGPQSVAFTNLLVGDVWLCGGQSNMEFPLRRAREGEAAVKAAHQPLIRLFTVKQQTTYTPAKTVTGLWRVCSPESVTEDGGVSAVGYYFAAKLRRETNVPIGLIKDCWGGTPAESWASGEALRSLGDFDPALAEVARLRARGGPQYGNFVSHWYDEFDAGQRDNAWTAAELNDHDWHRVTLPGGFAELGVPQTPAVAYFRRTVRLPEPLPTGPARIQLGVIERMDTVHINGHWVGASAWVENPRNYGVNPGVLKAGTNVITIRVFKLKAGGGFQSAPDQLKLVLGDKTEIPLAGDWKGKLSVDARPPHPLPLGFENWPTMPAVLYNGMLAPVAPLAICGALWYQGESNVGRAAQYRRLLPAMIADWRRAFGQGDFPFYIVSLAAFQPRKNLPGDDVWAELRAAQAFAANHVPNSGLALAIDVGNADDVHPIDKREVGERLALCALANHYGMPVAFAGPTFDRSEPLPGALRLHFRHTTGGLVTKGDPLGEFSLAGADKKWFWAKAVIEGETVVVSAPEVNAPRFVRYAWQANPRATLFNGAGLPAVPFRTDQE